MCRNARTFHAACYRKKSIQTATGMEKGPFICGMAPSALAFGFCAALRRPAPESCGCSEFKLNGKLNLPRVDERVGDLSCVRSDIVGAVEFCHRFKGSVVVVRVRVGEVGVVENVEDLGAELEVLLFRPATGASCSSPMRGPNRPGADHASDRAANLPGSREQ